MCVPKIMTLGGLGLAGAALGGKKLSPLMALSPLAGILASRKKAQQSAATMGG